MVTLLGRVLRHTRPFFIVCEALFPLGEGLGEGAKRTKEERKIPYSPLANTLTPALSQRERELAYAFLTFRNKLLN